MKSQLFSLRSHRGGAGNIIKLLSCSNLPLNTFTTNFCFTSSLYVYNIHKWNDSEQTIQNLFRWRKYDEYIAVINFSVIDRY